VTSVRQALAKLGAERFDYLINNAGTSLHKNFDETTEQELDAIYNVHFKGVFFLTQKLLPPKARSISAFRSRMGRVFLIGGRRALMAVNLPAERAQEAAKALTDPLSKR
jgi:NAD(P)-dependent dehydrogenase (short-subunit alcohol dehydrogenase family)